jgi:hypothetical protein
MKLSQPLFNEIRFDKDISLLKKLEAETRAEYTFKLGKGDNVQYPYFLEFKIRVIMYADELHNEIAGYTAEAQSTIMEIDTPEKDITVIQVFIFDIFTRCKKSLTQKLPEFNLNYLQAPDHQNLSEKLISGLIKLGFYK